MRAYRFAPAAEAAGARRRVGQDRVDGALHGGGGLMQRGLALARAEPVGRTRIDGAREAIRVSLLAPRSKHLCHLSP